MKNSLILVVLLLFNAMLFSQSINGKTLLEKAINYHDPDSNWSTFSNSFSVTMETPDKPSRLSNIQINLPNELFYIKMTRDTLITEYTIKKETCTYALNGEKNLTKDQQKQYNINCDRAQLYKNYYSYLYGLPMKLKDPGTIIDNKVEKKVFKGKTYLVLKVSYDKTVGSDVWYFYFNPKTYAMEIYQFYKTDDQGKLKTDSGEYILLSDETIINNIKMPKKRAWYYNKDSTYLGTDILSEN
tara:strand:- start:17547 stop:18272 length:726 start_codon:yes stop_codon:yes gene_type:complete